MRRAGLVLAALAAAALGGCFSSETALYGDSGGRCPFSQATQFGTPAVDAGGATVLEPSFVIAPEGAMCVQTDANNETRRIAFAPLAPGWYVAEEFKADRGRYYYGLVRIEGDRIWSYQPNCGDFTEAALTEAGVASPWADMFAPATAPGDADAKQAAPKPLRPPSSATAPAAAAPDDAQANDGSCLVTSRAQIEGLFRRWISLGRQADSYGDRMLAP